VLHTVLIRTVILFVVLAAIGVYAYVKFGQIRARLTGLVGSQRRELAQQVASRPGRPRQAQGRST